MACRTAVFIALALALTGCANPPSSQRDLEDAATPLLCIGAAECTLAWRSAQVWIAENSYWKIQVATDAVIQTYNGDPYTVMRRYTLTRIPIGGDREEIRIASSCANRFRCHEDEAAAHASFKRQVRASIAPR